MLRFVMTYKREIRKLALLNDLRIYELTNAIIEEALKTKKK